MPYADASFDFVFCGNVTALISNKERALKQMDRILVFDKGAIIEDNTPLELLAYKDGYFAKLWGMQMKGSSFV